jgi:hypothetical protein
LGRLQSLSAVVSPGEETGAGCEARPCHSVRRIVVIENITRYLEQGMKPLQAAFRGAKEIGFTVVSMSTSLIAVFILILMMGGAAAGMLRPCPRRRT